MAAVITGRRPVRCTNHGAMQVDIVSLHSQPSDWSYGSRYSKLLSTKPPTLWDRSMTVWPAPVVPALCLISLNVSTLRQMEQTPGRTRR